MGYLRGIEIKNYRVFRHISLGQISWNVGNPLPNLCVFMGKNGCGKSTLLPFFYQPLTS
jgi:predicted ATPase